MKSSKNLISQEKEKSQASRYGDYLNRNFGVTDLKRSDKKGNSIKKKSKSKVSQQFTTYNNYFTRITEKKSLPIMVTNKPKLSSKELPVTDKATSNSKININFEIKNLNIFKANANNPLRKGHRKTLTTLELHKPIHAQPKKGKIKSKMYTRVASPKATGHRKTRSQDFEMPLGFDPNKFIAQDHEASIVCKYHLSSRAGMVQDKPKTNQDAFICIPNFVMNNISLFGVCDGHGVNGHFVSEFIKEILSQNIEYYSIKNKIFLKEPKPESVELVLKQAFRKTAIDLDESQIDITFSGSTTVLCMIIQDHIFCANIGDSRAIVCSQTKEEAWKAKPISIDHKADLPSEAERIIKNRGRLEPYRDQNGEQMGPYRVWLQHEQIPGLAMTRSFGDAVASSVGVICEPEIIKHKITKSDKFMILASDGLWEFISNEQAMEAVIPCFMRNDIEEAVKLLEQLALSAWVEEDELIDDITIEVVFFKNY